MKGKKCNYFFRVFSFLSPYRFTLKVSSASSPKMWNFQETQLSYISNLSNDRFIKSIKCGYSLDVEFDFSCIFNLCHNRFVKSIKSLFKLEKVFTIKKRLRPCQKA